jgi:hypothetical protein
MQRITVDLEQSQVDFIDELTGASRITASALMRVLIEFPTRGLMEGPLHPHRTGEPVGDTLSR